MVYDILIIGGGSAGITAGIYAKRAGRKVAVIEKYVPGGQLNLIGEIENYTGFEKIEGAELAVNFYKHASSLGLEFITDEIVDFKFDNPVKTLQGKNNTYQAYSVILALGSHPRELNIEGEEKYKGRGVSYCALCDGNFFRNKTVAVVGSGDSAFSDALYLSPICSQVFILSKPNLKLHNYTENEIADLKNVKLIKGALSTSIDGDEKVNKLCYKSNEEDKCLLVDGVFVAIGRTPDTQNLKDKISLSERGFIITNNKMETNVEGVFACGDIREENIKQIACAVGDGAVAGTEASKYVLRLKHSLKISD